MNVPRAVAVLALAAGGLAVACSSEAPNPAGVVVRATPPPTAYIGMIVTAPASLAPPEAVVLSDRVSDDRALSDVHEFARIASVGMVELPPVSVPSVSVPRGVVVAAGAPRAPRAGGARARVVDRAATTDKRVALTFDAGADRGYAEQILNSLRDAGVHASFGMTGHWAEANPDLLRRMVAEGHHLINHTQTHDSFTGVSTGRGPKSADARARELAMTEQAVQRIAGVTTKPYFRPPYGDTDTSVSEDVQAQGYDIVAMWTVDSQGWNGLSRAGIEARCLRAAAPGAVYVFHVGSAAQDGPALPGVIEGLRKQGYQMGSLDWLLNP